MNMASATIISFFLLLCLLLATGCAREKESKVCFRQECFEAEVVTTPEKIERGLMYREHLDEDKGMLFVFSSEGIHSFWMKNTLIPLDMIWINKKQQVVYIARNVQPCTEQECPSINPGVEALYVLEINSNMSEKKGISVSDIAQIEI